MNVTRYAYSLKTHRVKEPEFPYSGEVLSTPESAINFFKGLRDSDIEKFTVAYLDAKNKLCGISIQPGSVDQTAVYPREIAKHALLNGATSVIMAHNHPSGNPNPSSADRELTKLLKEALQVLQIRIHDHIIIGDDSHFSFAEEGYL